MGERKRAVIYCRVSTEEQAENGTSLETQETAGCSKAESMGLEIAKVCRDEGVSGSLYESRPGIHAALREIEAKRADTLLVAKIDRLGRSAQAVLKIAERIDRAGGYLLTTDGMEFGSTAVGRLMLTLLAAFAEFERNMIRERTMTGCRRSAEKGKQPSRGKRPYGYHLVTEADVLTGRFPAGTQGTYVVNEEQAVVVKEMFARYAGGSSLNGLCTWLNDSGFETSHKGAHWRPRSVMYMLENPIYKGTATHGRHETLNDESRITEKGLKTSRYQKIKPGAFTGIPAPQIVAESIWDACQSRLKRGRAEFSGNPRRMFLLSTISRCPICGRGLAGRHTGTHGYYVCNRTGLDAHDPRINFKASDLDRDVIDAMTQALACPESIEAAMEAHRRRQTENRPVIDVEAIRRQIEELDRKETATAKAQVDALLSGRSTHVYDRLLQDLNEHRSKLQKRLSEAEQTESPAKPSKLTTLTATEAIAKLEKVLASDEITTAQKREIIRGVVSEIVPNKGKVEVTFRPFSTDETVQLRVVM